MKFRQYDQLQTKFVNIDYRRTLGEDSDVVILNNIIESLDSIKDTLVEDHFIVIMKPILD